MRDDAYRLSSSSACSGDICRHVNQKCAQGKVMIMIDEHLVRKHLTIPRARDF